MNNQYVEALEDVEDVESSDFTHQEKLYYAVATILILAFIGAITILGLVLGLVGFGLYSLFTWLV